jgi:hypothetical protein
LAHRAAGAKARAGRRGTLGPAIRARLAFVRRLAVGGGSEVHDLALQVQADRFPGGTGVAGGRGSASAATGMPMTQKAEPELVTDGPYASSAIRSTRQLARPVRDGLAATSIGW